MSMSIDEMIGTLNYMRENRNEYVVAPADYPTCMTWKVTDQEMIDVLFSPDLSAILSKAKKDAEMVEKVTKMADAIGTAMQREKTSGKWNMHDQTVWDAAMIVMRRAALAAKGA